MSNRLDLKKLHMFNATTDRPFLARTESQRTHSTQDSKIRVFNKMTQPQPTNLHRINANLQVFPKPVLQQPKKTLSSNSNRRSTPDLNSLTCRTNSIPKLMTNPTQPNSVPKPQKKTKQKGVRLEFGFIQREVPVIHFRRGSSKQVGSNDVQKLNNLLKSSVSTERKHYQTLSMPLTERTVSPTPSTQNEAAGLNLEDFKLNLIDLRCNFDEENEQRTVTSVSNTDVSNTPRFSFTRPLGMKNGGLLNFSRNKAEEGSLLDDLNESIQQRPKNVYIFQINPNLLDSGQKL